MHKRHTRRLRAVVIDLRRTGRIVIFSLVFVLIAAGLFLGFKKYLPKGDADSGNPISITESFKKAVSFFIGFDPGDLTTILKTEVPAMKAAERSALWALAEGEETEEVYNPAGADTKDTEPSPDPKDGEVHNITEIDSSQAKALSDSDKKILLKNETGYQVDIASMLKAKMPVELKHDGPEILIVHTHATESFTEEGVTSYNSSSSDRTQDTEKNIVKVGEKMAEIFRENGIETLHDKTLHDYPNYNGSYGNSLNTMESYLKKYPSIKMIIDVHRDAIVASDGSKAKVVTEIDGKKAAQLMFVIGTNAGGLEHPNWQENLTAAVKFQSAIEEKYPGLMRGINLRKERFNEHLTKGSMIIEVGTSGNTLNEALYSSQLAAKVIADCLNGKA